MAESEPSESDEQTQTDMVNAIAQILAKNRNEMVTKVIVLAEVIDERGERAMWTCTSPGLVLWDEQGMLGWALNRVKNYDLLTSLSRLDDDD